MDELVKIFNDLKNESSRIGKESILRANQDNNTFMMILKFVFNTYIVTGLSAKKVNKKVDKSILGDTHIPHTINGLLDYLKINNTGRDVDIAVVQKVISTIPTEEGQKLMREIVTKSLKVGITEKTINKVYGKGTVPSFALMLAESYAKKESKVTGRFYITLKLDGNRCIAIKDNDAVKFFTRKGQPIDGLEELEEEVMTFPNGTVLDGELLLVNKNSLPSDELFRATQKVVRKDGIKKDLEFHIFDTLSSSEFKDGKSKNTYEDRREKLESIYNLLTGVNKFKFLQVLPVLYSGEDKNMIAVLMKWAEEEGYEGLMVNTADGLYESKRSNDLLKVKTFKSSDGLIIGVYEGQGKNIGKLGGVLITYRDIIVRIGSGFTDEERRDYWKNPEGIVGKVGQYNYFEESTNEKGELDLRFATWKGVRFDKNIEDVNYE